MLGAFVREAAATPTSTPPLPLPPPLPPPPRPHFLLATPASVLTRGHFIRVSVSHPWIVLRRHLQPLQLARRLERGPASRSMADDLSPYELQRLENIRRNQVILSNLGLADDGDAASQQIKRRTPAQPRAQQHTRDEPAMLRQRSSVNYSENFAAERARPAASSSAELGQTALTIRQPFASGIMLGHKTVENRSWGQGLLLPANGAWIAVHAAKKPADAKDPNLAALREAWTARRIVC